MELGKQENRKRISVWFLLSCVPDSSPLNISTINSQLRTKEYGS